MRRLTVLTAAVLAAVSIGCESAANTNVANKTNANANANSNVAVVVNSNANTMNSNVTSSSNRYNANITREEYDKDKDTYSKQAKDAGDTIGAGLSDGWLWTKTKSALATTDGLRDSTINVDVNNAVVTLKGTVATAAQKTQAETVAKAIKDVTSVKNELKVQAGDSMTNQMVNGNTSTTKSNANAK